MSDAAEKHPKPLTSRIEWGVAMITTLMAIWLHVIFFTHAGGLWRDEAGIVRLATLPTFSEMSSRLGHESCPLIFPAAIRGWSSNGLGQTDVGLRAVGFSVGLLLICALWVNAWKLSGSVPLISLGLLGASSTVVRWGDSLRAYGLGSVLMLFTVTSVWCFVRLPSRGRWLIAALSALASVQCLFQNSFLLLAVCLAGCAVCLRRRNVKSTLAVFAIGAVAAVSLLPYQRIIHAAEDWSVLSQSGFIPSHVWKHLSTALTLGPEWTRWAWIGLVVLVAMLLPGDLVKRGTLQVQSEETLASHYATVALICGVVSFFIFLWLSRMPSQVWYFLPLMTFVAVCGEAALKSRLARRRIWEAIAVVFLVAVASPTTLKGVKCRQTNVDRIAAHLASNAAAEDLVVVYPWYNGISFSRYYQGRAAWNTLPPLDDHGFHRYDLVKEKLAEERPTAPMFDMVQRVIQSGHRVWFVGGFAWPEPNQPPPTDLPPAPNSPAGWDEELYSRIWGLQLADLLLQNAAEFRREVVEDSGCVSSFENLELYLAVGKRAEGAGAGVSSPLSR